MTLVVDSLYWFLLNHLKGRNKRGSPHLVRVVIIHQEDQTSQGRKESPLWTKITKILYGKWNHEALRDDKETWELLSSQLYLGPRSSKASSNSTIELFLNGMD
jgi:hypothetical protein